MSLESSHDLFFTTIIESAKEIILDSKKLINLITNTTDDLENEEIANGVADQSVETEARTVKLVEHVVKFVEKNSAEAGAKVHCEFLLDATKAVKNSILELIRASKDAVYNRYDYLTQQRMRNCCRVVAESLKNVLSASDTLRSVLEAPPSLQGSESGLLTPNVSLSNMAEADYSTVFATTEIELTKDAKNAIVSLNRLKQAAISGTNEDEFLALSKEASNMATELLITARTYKLKEPADKLKEVTVAVISAAKMMFHNPGDEVFQQQLELSISAVAKAIKNVLYAVNHIARNGVVNAEETAPTTDDPDIDREVAVMDSVVVDQSKTSFKAPSGTQNQTEKEREKLIKIMNEKKKEQEEKEKKREAEKKLRTQSSASLLPGLPATPLSIQDKSKTLTPKEIKEMQKREKKEAEKKAKAEKEAAKKAAKKKPAVDIEGNNVSSLRRIESDEVRIDLSENSKLEEGSDKLSQEGSEKILAVLQAMFSKFKKEWTSQSSDKKKKNTEAVRDEMKRILAEFNVSAKKYYASQFLSLGNSLAKDTEGHRLQYAEFQLTYVTYQFNKRKQFIRRPENNDEAQLSDDIIRTAEIFATSTVEMIVYASQAVLNEKQDSKIIADTVKKILEALKRAVELISTAGKRQKQVLWEPLLVAAGDCVVQSGIRGLLDDNIVQIANGVTLGARLVEGSIQQRIYNTSASVRTLCGQLVTALCSVAEQLGSHRIHSTLIMLGGLVFSFLEAKDRLLNSFETARYLAARFAKPSQPSQHSLDDEPISVIDVDDEDTNIWDGPKLVLQRSSDGLLHLKAGTLNQLVEALTNDEIIDNQFMKTFITTYQSFTTPSKLLEKLIQRYDAPATKVPKDKVIQIRQRVSVVIKYWVENQFKDFHESLVGKLFDFYEKKLAVDGHEELAKLLKRELEKRVNERSEKIKFLLNTPPAQLDILETGRLSPAHYFMALNDAEIARQLTLIDYSTFVSIEPQELLNQAWNKPDLKHRAPNVLAMISRANKVSFWIATLVMLYDNAPDRIKVIMKIISIADELRKQNNFHTLMGIVAGLNMSSVARLKKTFEEVPTLYKETFKTLEKLMSPNSSYKIYRTTLNKSSLPCLPYIGTYLSDCTFIEDGNPDSTKDGLINFQKRELVYKAISDVARYQQSPYQFPITDPIHTFFVELPGCTDKDLYNLSLQYEPREGPRKQRSARSVN